MNYEQELKQRAKQTEEILEKFTPNGDIPPLLKEAMMYSLKAGGKRIRPVLLLETVRVLNGRMHLAYPLAAAIEMIHTYSLIHDDLPAMDNDTLRRGRATNHVVYGEAMAILAGDALLNCAVQIMTENIPYDEEKYLKGYLLAMNEIVRAAGHNGMIAGQVMDMLSEGGKPDKDTLTYIHSHKTGALLTAPVTAGVYLSLGDEQTMQTLAAYARAVGLAFQLVDDILDIKGDKGKMGKSVGKDEESKKLTYPLVYGMDKTYEKISELYEDAKKAIGQLNIDKDFLLGTAEFICKRDY